MSNAPFHLISDLHKDARGFRPSASWMAHFNGLPHSEQEQIYLAMSKELDEALAHEERLKKASVASFETQVSNLISSGAKDRETAIRWIADSEGVDIANDPQGIGYLEYRLNLPYNYLKKRDAA